MLTTRPFAACAPTSHAARFARASLKVGRLRLILPNGEERHYGGDEASVPAPVPAGACVWCGRSRAVTHEPRLMVHGSAHAQQQQQRG